MTRSSFTPTRSSETTRAQGTQRVCAALLRRKRRAEEDLERAHGTLEAKRTLASELEDLIAAEAASTPFKWPAAPEFAWHPNDLCSLFGSSENAGPVDKAQQPQILRCESALANQASGIEVSSRGFRIDATGAITVRAWVRCGPVAPILDVRLVVHPTSVAATGGCECRSAVPRLEPSCGVVIEATCRLQATPAEAADFEPAIRAVVMWREYDVGRASRSRELGTWSVPTRPTPDLKKSDDSLGLVEPIAQRDVANGANFVVPEHDWGSRRQSVERLISAIESGGSDCTVDEALGELQGAMRAY